MNAQSIIEQLGKKFTSKSFFEKMKELDGYQQFQIIDEAKKKRLISKDQHFELVLLICREDSRRVLAGTL